MGWREKFNCDKMSGKVVYDIILEIKIKGELLFQRKHRKIGRGEIHITKALYFLESTTFNYILFFN